MRKRVILTTVFILALLIIVVAVIGGVIVYNQNRQRESSSIIGEVSQEITEGNTTQVDFLNKYEDYITQNIFGKNQDLQLIDVAFISLDEDEEPILTYISEDNKVAFLTLEGDIVRESDSYSDVNIRTFYNIEDKKINYFLEKDEQYLYLPDVVSRKSNIKTIKVDDESLEYTYIDLEKPVSMKEVKKETLTNDLKSVYEEFKNTTILTKEVQENIDEKVKEIEENTLKSDTEGIYNSQYKIAYGSYVCGSDTFTINANNSATYVHDNPGNGFDLDGSFKLIYDTINFNNDDKVFKIVGNNQIERIDTEQIFNLK